jgi:tRNA modification GTPase
MNRTDTIFALASARGRAGVAVVRVSGPKAFVALTTLVGKADFPARQAVYLPLRQADGSVIDRALVLKFAAPNSFTGEDVVEFQIHGGRAVLSALMSELSALSGFRPAQAGEFSRRAVENGKFDLTQAEAIADLVDAETEAQRRQALKQYDGALGALYGRWRAELVAIQAQAEAAIDFADEDIPDDPLNLARGRAAVLLKEMRTHLDDKRCGELVREGLKLAVIGPPNAGKSSLINALVRRDVAIVSKRPGTTRDVIEVHLDVGGYAFVLADTAGLCEGRDEIEAEGVRRALAAASAADVIVLVRDGAAPEPFDLPARLAGKPLISVWNKADMPWPLTHRGFKISAQTGEGLDGLVAALADFAEERLYRADIPLTRERHRAALNDAVAALARAQTAPELELFAEDLRLAARAVGRVVGIVDVEEVLDIVFKDFCIGK